MEHHNPGRLMALSGLCVALLFAAGCLIGGALGQAQIDGTWVTWQALGQPPTAAVRIEAGDTQTVWVRATDGWAYRADWQRAACAASPPQADCWHVVNEVTGPAPWQQGQQCTTEYPRMAAPPPTMVTCASTREIHVPEYYGETSYALLSDGTVWVWAHGAGAFGPLDDILIGRVQGSVAGGMVGLMLVAGLGVWRWARARTGNHVA